MLSHIAQKVEVALNSPPPNFVLLLLQRVSALEAQYALSYSTILERREISCEIRDESTESKALYSYSA